MLTSEPAFLIYQAFLQLEFAIKLRVYVFARHVQKGLFDSEVHPAQDPDTPALPGNSFNAYHDIKVGAWNNEKINFGFTTFALDEALHPDSKGQGADDLSTLVYALRCACAHQRSLTPQWNVAPKFQRVVTVLGRDIDLAALHKHPFDIAHVGGYAGYLAIKDEVLRQVIQRDGVGQPAL